MKLDPKALAYVGAALWGGSVLFVGLVNLSNPGYGSEFLNVLGSVYPGYHPAHTVESVLIGTGYGLLDGAIGGWLTGWLYNRVQRKPT